MRVVVLTDSHKIGANYILTHIPKNKDIKIVGIIERKPNKLWYIKKNVIRMIVISGIIFSLQILIFFLTVKGINFIKKIFYKKRKILNVHEIAEKYKIPFYETEDVNGKESIKIIKKLKPDLIISNYFDQILKRKVLDIPLKGTINFHPGLLPNYRGIFPYFWGMVNKEKIAGFTVHFVTTAIDKGKIVARKTFKIKKHDTAMDLPIKSARIGLPWLNKILKNIKLGKIQTLEIKNLEGKYYSIPTRNAIKKFYENGRKLFSIRKLYKQL